MTSFNSRLHGPGLAGTMFGDTQRLSSDVSAAISSAVMGVMERRDLAGGAGRPVRA